MHDRSTLKIHVCPLPPSFFLFLFAASFVSLESRNRSILPFIQFLSLPPSISFHLFFSFFLLFPPGFAPFSRNISRYRGGTAKKLADRLISEQDTSFFPQFRFIRAVCIVFSPSSRAVQFTIDSSADTSPFLLPSLVTSTTTIDSFHGTEKRLAPIADPPWIIFPRSSVSPLRGTLVPSFNEKYDPSLHVSLWQFMARFFLD